MDAGTLFKLAGLMLWPFLLIFIYFLFDRKGFKKQLDRFRQDKF